MKTFPIQGDTRRDDNGRMQTIPATTIPWDVAEIIYNRGYAKRFGTAQSLERIAERGGFYREEVIIFLHNIVEMETTK